MHKTNTIEVKHPIKLLTDLSPDFSITRKCRIKQSKNHNKSVQSKYHYTLTTGRKCGCIHRDMEYNNFLKLDNQRGTLIPYNMPYSQPIHENVPDILVPVTSLSNNCHSCAIIYDEVNVYTKLNGSDFRTDEQLINKTRLTHPEKFYKKYYSLENLVTSNEQNNFTEQRIPLYGYSQSSLAALHLRLNTDGLKQFYQSNSTHVVVCEYPVNLYIRYMGKYKIPSIDLIQIDDFWNHIGWGYLVAVANRNSKVPSSFDSVALILCQPITFKQIWKGYALLPNKIRNSYLSTTCNLNSNIIEHHVRQIHKPFTDTLNYSHCILMELTDSSETIQSKQQNVKFTSNLKMFFTKCKANLIKSSKRDSLNTSQMKSSRNREIYTQSAEFFSQLDELISNAVAFRFQPESMRKEEIEEYTISTMLQQKNPKLKSRRSLSASSLFINKNQISLPCLFRHVYSISREDLNTIRTVYGFQV
ncbi:unnamed protein product [Trichobilharzia regenti]|nr:unnamed protein product [Trichobilharzia regenti]